MSVLHEFLSRLKGVRQVGSDRWKALCPAHADKNPSLSIAKGDKRAILCKCWAGCEFADIMRAVDLDASRLYPDTNCTRRSAIRRPFAPTDVPAKSLQIAQVQVLRAIIVINDLLAGQVGRNGARDELLDVSRKLNEIRGGAHAN